MEFFPEKQLLKCEHCGAEKEFQMNANEELSFSTLMEKNDTWADETHVVCCKNCGAKEVVSKTEISKACSFCGTSNVVETDELSGMKPNAIVPFKISREQANERAVAWAKKRFFAPRRFKKSINTEDINGLYNPAFTFDTDTLSFYRGRLGRYKYVTRHVNGKTVTERKVEYFNISGTYSAFFDDVLIQASTVIRQQTIDKLQPFMTNDSKKYATEFLHGYTATQYTKDGKQCWTEARKLIDQRIRAGILSKYTYDFVDSLSISTECSNIKYKYLLLPIYVGHFNFKRKLYNFFVNGFNGKVAGRMPISPLKVGILAVIIAAAIGVAAYFLIPLII
jgi:hypothetical protein